MPSNVLHSVTHLLTVGPRTIALRPDEARVVIRGEVSELLAQRFERLGIRIPARGRGTIRYTLQIRTAGGTRISEAYCRRYDPSEIPQPRRKDG